MSVALQAEARMNDAELVAHIASGDLHSLGKLYDRYSRDIRRFVGRLGVHANHIDDLVQTTFLEVTHAAPRYDGRVAVKNWLFGIAAIAVRRHRRSLSRLAARIDAWARELSVFPSAVSPADDYDASHEARRAMRALDKLSAKKREVFLMVAVENASGEETARALGIPLATVWTRLHHARRELRAQLAEEEP
ncbi:MAG: RNA polymerase sigma factor [Polyangiaceae bacterium]